MVFCIGYNYTGQGWCTLHPGTRRRVEYLAMWVQVLSWVVVMPAMWVVGTNFYNSGGTSLSWDEYVEDVWDICSFVFFCGGNSVYVVVSLTLVLARLVRKKNVQAEWIPRKKVEYCGEIIIPDYRGLEMFHYLVHMVAMVVNIAAAFCGADIYLSILMIIITLLQSILSYLYSTDIALCFCFCIFCNIFLVRRQPRGDMLMEASWMYEEWRLDNDRMELVIRHEEPDKTLQNIMGSYKDYLYLTHEPPHTGVENQNYENKE